MPLPSSPLSESSKHEVQCEDVRSQCETFHFAVYIFRYTEYYINSSYRPLYRPLSCVFPSAPRKRKRRRKRKRKRRRRRWRQRQRRRQGALWKPAKDRCCVPSVPSVAHASSAATAVARGCLHSCYCYLCRPPPSHHARRPPTLSRHHNSTRQTPPPSIVLRCWGRAAARPPVGGFAAVYSGLEDSLPPESSPESSPSPPLPLNCAMRLKRGRGGEGERGERVRERVGERDTQT